MKITGIIPARYSSTRFPGKPLAELAGKPMIQHVYERAASATTLSEVIVATDDARIMAAVEKFGGRAVMTSPEHPTGTDRLAEVAANLDSDLIVNIQGDEPLLASEAIDAAVQPLMADPDLPMGTLKHRIEDPSEVTNPNVVKVVTDQKGLALYFSRAPIPYNRDSDGSPVYYKHIGLYVYRREFLLTFARLAPTPLETSEKLEQLRALENGYKIMVVETTHQSIGVDTVEDLERVRQILATAQ
ncbi:MAG: 3-deoxy-manno-octulosonate cytidylyltransferase [Firmicutes bacterium]|nr:3-deoxy-manno-octulosonate cytidylyltransferase [Bacillota bacterium]